MQATWHSTAAARQRGATPPASPNLLCSLEDEDLGQEFEKRQGLSAESMTEMNSAMGTPLLGLIKVSFRGPNAKCLSFLVFSFSFSRK
jgi:hypothetical protein